MLTFLSESARDFQETATVGGFNHGTHNSFDEIFTEAYDTLMSSGVDVMTGVND